MTIGPRERIYFLGTVRTCLWSETLSMILLVATNCSMSSMDSSIVDRRHSVLSISQANPNKCGRAITQQMHNFEKERIISLRRETIFVTCVIQRNASDSYRALGSHQN